MVVATTIAAFVVGLLIGSFLNVVVHRVPRGESIVSPGSRCPGCGTAIRPWDNVPVLSWLVLRGRCRACGTGIPVRYPAVEVLTAVLFGATAARFGPDAALPALLVFVAALVAVSAIDVEHRRIPTVIVWPTLGVTAVWLGGVSAMDGDVRSLVEAVAGGFLAAAPLFVVWALRPGAMGFGDVRLATLLGVVLGWLHLGLVAVALFVAFVAGSVVGVALIVVAGRSRRSAVPFGPFLAVGAFAAMMAGEALIEWYLGATGL